MASNPLVNSGWSVAPYFVVADVVATAEYYRNKLGFHFERYFGDPPAFCMVKRGGIIVMLSQIAGTTANPNKTVDPCGEAWDAYVWVDDVDALHAEYAAKGVSIPRGLCDQPYGCRDFDVEDLNGYRLCFGQPTDG